MENFKVGSDVFVKETKEKGKVVMILDNRSAYVRTENGTRLLLKFNEMILCGGHA